MPLPGQVRVEIFDELGGFPKLAQGKDGEVLDVDESTYTQVASESAFRHSVDAIVTIQINHPDPRTKKVT